MNKIFTLILVLFSAVSAFADNYTVKFGDTVVKNGDNFVCTNAHNTEIFPGYYEFKIEPDINCVPSVAGKMTITVTALDGSSDVSFCWPELCKMANSTGVSDSKDVAANAEEHVKIYYLYTYPEGEECPKVTRKVKVRFDLMFETLEFTLTLTNEETAVNSVSVKSPVSIASGVMNYNLPSGSTVNVYSIIGSLVKSERVSGAGSIDMTSLPKGIYIYNVAGKKKSSGKFQIR